MRVAALNTAAPRGGPMSSKEARSVPQAVLAAALAPPGSACATTILFPHKRSSRRSGQDQRNGDRALLHGRRRCRECIATIPMMKLSGRVLVARPMQALAATRRCTSFLSAPVLAQASDTDTQFGGLAHTRQGDWVGLRQRVTTQLSGGKPCQARLTSASSQRARSTPRSAISRARVRRMLEVLSGRSQPRGEIQCASF